MNASQYVVPVAERLTNVRERRAVLESARFGMGAVAKVLEYLIANHADGDVVAEAQIQFDLINAE